MEGKFLVVNEIFVLNFKYIIVLEMFLRIDFNNFFFFCIDLLVLVRDLVVLCWI